MVRCLGRCDITSHGAVVTYYQYNTFARKDAKNKQIAVFKENLNASRPSEHPSVRGGKNVKTFRWAHRLQKQDLFMAFKRVSPCCSFSRTSNISAVTRSVRIVTRSVRIIRKVL